MDPDSTRRCHDCGAPLNETGLCVKCLLVLAENSSTSVNLPAPDRLEAEGSLLGRYKLLEKIGEGGFGVVWAAEQTEPVKRRVALKIIKLGMDTKQVVARFEAERQALAMMDHPSIAKVHDAGATDTGRPFFVMELIKGIPITEYCDGERLTIEERLGLFMQVCHAIQHAHQKGIIHRDIKPPNVLVTLQDGQPVPKIIDFGIAKASQMELTEKSIHTGMSQIMGTPAYMSPEQVDLNGVDIDTRSDIYSLGALLHELLAGSPPFDIRELTQAGVDGMRRIIREREPARASARVLSLAEEERKTMASRRRTDPRKLVSALRGDLDWIVQKTLEKPRNARYASAANLAVDIQRFLAGETVDAKPPAVGYWLRKFLNRHRKWAAAAAMVLITLIGGIASTTWQAYKATAAASEAKAARTEEAAHRETAEEALRIAERIQQQTRRELYAADLLGASHALAQGDIAQARRYLTRYLPGVGGEDLRTFPWNYHWNECQGDQLHTFLGHGNIVSAVAFSPDGKLLASGDWDGLVILWEVSSLSELSRINPAGGKIASLAFGGNPELLAVGSNSKASVYDLRDAEKPRLKLERPSSFAQVDFLPNSSRIVIGEGGNRWGGRNTGRTWVWNTDLNAKEFDVPNSGGRFALARNTHEIFTGVRSNRLWKINLNSKSITGSTAFQSDLYSIASSEDGTWLAASGSIGGSFVQLRAGDSMNLVRELSKSMGYFPTMALAISNEGTLARSTHEGQHVHLGKVNDPSFERILKGHGGEVWGGAFSPDGKLLATCGNDMTTRLWRTDGKSIRDPWIYSSLGKWDSDPVFSLDGSVVIAPRKDSLHLWDTRTLENLGELHGARHAVGFIARQGHEVLVTLGRALTIRESRVRGPEHRAEISLSDETTEDSSFGLASDGATFVFSKRAYPRISVWDLPSGTKRSEIRPELGLVLDLQIHPQESQFFTGHYKNTAALWDFDGNLLREFRGHRDSVSSVATTSDGRLLATGSWDSTVKVWDTATASQVATLTGHWRGVLAVRFSKQDDVLASASEDGTVRLWDTRTWRDVGSLKISYPIPSIAFSSSGELLAFVEAPSRGESKIHFIRAPLPSEHSSSNSSPNLASEFAPRAALGAIHDDRAPLTPSRSGEQVAPPKNRAEQERLKRLLGATNVLAETNFRSEPLLDGQIKIHSHCNALPNLPWHNLNDIGNDLSSFPGGNVDLGGIRFATSGIIQLRSRALDPLKNSNFPAYPREVTGIQVGRKCGKLHFLQGTGWISSEGAIIGFYRIHYTDGESVEAPITYGKNVRNWQAWKGMPAEAAGPPEAWSGGQSRYDSRPELEFRVRLYALSWINPHPEKEIQTIDFVSNMRTSAPFLLAITAE